MRPGPAAIKTMLLFFLLVFFLILLPLTEGFLLAWGLRTLYLEKFPELLEGEESDVEITSRDPVSESAEDERTDEEVPGDENPETGEEDVATLPDEEESTEESGVESERKADEDVMPENQAESVPTEAEDEDLPESSGIPDQGASQFPVDNIIDGMLSENRPEIPEDLSARIEEDEARSEGKFGGMDFDPLDDEDELMNRMMENIGANNSEDDSPINFQDDLSPDEAATEISPMAVELLGEDFDFDSLIEEAEQEKPETLDAEDDFDWQDIARSAGKFVGKSENDSIGMETDPSEASDISGNEGLFHSEAISFGDDSLSNILSGEVDVLPVFPDELCQNTIVEPETPREAERFNFVEESRPMFVRKRNS